MGKSRGKTPLINLEIGGKIIRVSFSRGED